MVGVCRKCESLTLILFQKGMPGVPLKVTTPGNPTLRRLPRLDNCFLRWRQRFQFSDERWNLFVPCDPAELLLRNQESRPNPTLPMVAVVPAFHVSTNPLHN